MIPPVVTLGNGTATVVVPDDQVLRTQVVEPRVVRGTWVSYLTASITLQPPDELLAWLSDAAAWARGGPSITVLITHPDLGTLFSGRMTDLGATQAWGIDAPAALDLQAVSTADRCRNAFVNRAKLAAGAADTLQNRIARWQPPVPESLALNVSGDLVLMGEVADWPDNAAFPNAVYGPMPEVFGLLAQRTGSQLVEQLISPTNHTIRWYAPGADLGPFAAVIPADQVDLSSQLVVSAAGSVRTVSTAYAPPGGGGFQKVYGREAGAGSYSYERGSVVSLQPNDIGDHQPSAAAVVDAIFGDAQGYWALDEITVPLDALPDDAARTAAMSIRQLESVVLADVHTGQFGLDLPVVQVRGITRTWDGQSATLTWSTSLRGTMFSIGTWDDMALTDPRWDDVDPSILWDPARPPATWNFATVTVNTSPLRLAHQISGSGAPPSVPWNVKLVAAPPGTGGIVVGQCGTYTDDRGAFWDRITIPDNPPSGSVWSFVRTLDGKHIEPDLPWPIP